MPDGVRKDDADYGGKIFLPPSALNRLTMLHIRYPMLFELHNEDKGLKTFSGVLEFVAEEGRVYVPQWMMSTLNLSPGSILKITNQDVPLGKYVKIEPQSVDFLDISDPKAVLENVLRKFSTLTVNDIIEVNYNDKIYGIKVLEVKPESAFNSVCVIETDLETEFAPPVGYVEPDYAKLKEEAAKKRASNPARTLGTMAKSINYADIVQNINKPKDSFGGEGQKLSGRPNKPKEAGKQLENINLNPDAPPAPLNLPDGQLFFGFPLAPITKEDGDENPNERLESAFKGEGVSLRQSKKRKDKKAHESPRPKVHSPEVIEID